MGHRAELLCPKWRCESNRHAEWVASLPQPGLMAEGSLHTVFYLRYSWQESPFHLLQKPMGKKHTRSWAHEGSLLRSSLRLFLLGETSRRISVTNILSTLCFPYPLTNYVENVTTEGPGTHRSTDLYREPGQGFRRVSLGAEILKIRRNWNWSHGNWNSTISKGFEVRQPNTE